MSRAASGGSGGAEGTSRSSSSEESGSGGTADVRHDLNYTQIRKMNWVSALCGSDGLRPLGASEIPSSLRQAKATSLCVGTVERLLHNPMFRAHLNCN